MIDDPEEEAWQELEAKLNRAKELAEYRLKLLMQMPKNKLWVGLDDNDFQYQTPQYVLTMKYAEAILRDKNKCTALCTSPEPKLVGLTDEEIAEVVGSPLDEVYLADFRKIEAALKSKNT
jgi:hypothetical protein